jgi:hypothetical protein
VNSKFFRLICRILIVSLMALHLPMRSANAAMIGTESAIDQTVVAQNRDKVEAFMGRADVRQQFQTMGLSADDAKTRVASMTDQEINKVAGKIDELPAAGSTAGTVLIILLVVFIVLVITDILGWTKIFPWSIGPRE